MRTRKEKERKGKGREEGSDETYTVKKFISELVITWYRCEAFVLGISPPGRNASHHLYRYQPVRMSVFVIYTFGRHRCILYSTSRIHTQVRVYWLKKLGKYRGYAAACQWLHAYYMALGSTMLNQLNYEVVKNGEQRNEDPII
jgi:hypothetical protein